MLIDLRCLHIKSNLQPAALFLCLYPVSPQMSFLFLIWFLHYVCQRLQRTPVVVCHFDSSPLWLNDLNKPEWKECSWKFSCGHTMGGTMEGDGASAGDDDCLRSSSGRGLVKSSHPWPGWTNVRRDPRPCSDTAVQSTRTSLSPGSEMHRWPSRKTELLGMWSTAPGVWLCVQTLTSEHMHACVTWGPWVCVYLRVSVYARAPKPALAIDTLRVKHAWATSCRKEEMRGFRFTRCLHLSKRKALCLCALVHECGPCFLVRLQGCMGQRAGLNIAWTSERAFTLVSLLHC